MRRRGGFASLEGGYCKTNVMIADAIMPGMCGRKLSEVMQKLLPKIKIPFMSGYTDEFIRACLPPESSFCSSRDTLSIKERAVLDFG